MLREPTGIVCGYRIGVFEKRKKPFLRRPILGVDSLSAVLCGLRRGMFFIGFLRVVHELIIILNRKRIIKMRNPYLYSPVSQLRLLL